MYCHPHLSQVPPAPLSARPPRSLQIVAVRLEADAVEKLHHEIVSACRDPAPFRGKQTVPNVPQFH
jgi:hypothetical protein